MAVRTATFRFRDGERKAIEALAEELICSRTDVIRTAVSLLRQRENEGFRKARRAENLAIAFRDRLVGEFGHAARLELELRDDGLIDATIDGETLPEYASVRARPGRGVVHVDLFEPASDLTTSVADLDDEPGSRTSFLLRSIAYSHGGQTNVPILGRRNEDV